MAKGLSYAEKARLGRLTRTGRDVHGRRQSALLPSKLARTSTFVPRRHGLSSNVDLVPVYVVRSHSVVEVRERELGTWKRDALIARFQLRARRYETIIAIGQVGSAVCRTGTTWREVLIATGLTAHVNTLLETLRVFKSCSP